MDDVARKAGVSKGALYLYFTSKDELYLTLAAKAMEDLVRRMESASVEGSGLDRVARLLESYAAYAYDDGMRFRLASCWISPDYELSAQGEAAQRYGDSAMRVLKVAASAVEVGKADGSIRPELDTRMTIMQLWSAILGASLLQAKSAEQTTTPAPQLDPAAWHAVTGLPATPFEGGQLVRGTIDLLMRALRR